MDEPKALRLFKEAAGLGHRGSVFGLGMAYEHGELGVEVVEGKALQFYIDVAALGCIDSHKILAKFYEDGHFCGHECVFEGFEDVDVETGSFGGITLVVLDV